MFSGLWPLEIEEIDSDGEVIRVAARTPGGSLACPDCGVRTARVHSYSERTVNDLPIGARQVVLLVRVRRLVCEGCRRTFREQLPGVLARYQRRTPRLAAVVGAVVRELAGRASTRVLAGLAIHLSRHTALRLLMRLPLPQRTVPRVLGVDDFALRKRRRYATVLIDAETRQRIDVLPDRLVSTLEAWLRDHPGVEIVTRDSSGAYAEAIRRALPHATQVADRWHIWANLGKAALIEVAAHSACWAKASLRRNSKQDQNNLQRWHQVHDLLNKGVGLMECARRLNLSLNTVNGMRECRNPNGCNAFRSTGPLSSIRSVSISSAAGPKIQPSRSCIFSPRQKPWDIREASTCSTGTSPRAASRATGHPSPHAA